MRQRIVLLLMIVGFCRAETGFASTSPPLELATTQSVEGVHLPLALEDITATYTTRAGRDALLRELRVEKLEKAFQGPVSSSSLRLWSSAFWAAKFLQSPDTLTREGVHRALNASLQQGEGFQRAALEVAYALDKSAFAR
jgi:hypothetical protein